MNKVTLTKQWVIQKVEKKEEQIMVYIKPLHRNPKELFEGDLFIMVSDLLGGENWIKSF